LTLISEIFIFKYHHKMFNFFTFYWDLFNTYFEFQRLNSKTNFLISILFIFSFYSNKCSVIFP